MTRSDVHDDAPGAPTNGTPVDGMRSAQPDDIVARVLARAGRASDEERWDDAADGDQLDRADRAALRRVSGLSTELTDISELEYRQLRLERVVLVGLWSRGPAEQAELSLVELAALAETAGSQVLDRKSVV